VTATAPTPPRTSGWCPSSGDPIPLVRSRRRLWAIAHGRRREYDHGNFPTGVTLVDVIAASRTGMDEPRQPPILAIRKSPQFVAFITRGDPGGCRGSLPADLNVDVRVGADVPVPSRVVVRSAIRSDHDEILIPTCVDQRHCAITPGPSPRCGEEQSWPTTYVATHQPAGEAIGELMKPQVRDLNQGSRCVVHDAVCSTTEVGALIRGRYPIGPG
jgi:hypothetical protein